jgi:hypothetical protein
VEWLIQEYFASNASVENLNQRRICMKSQTLIYIVGIALFLAVVVAVIITFWAAIPATTFLATVSWNG